MEPPLDSRLWSPQEPQMLTIVYEDIQRDALRWFPEIASFIGLPRYHSAHDEHYAPSNSSSASLSRRDVARVLAMANTTDLTAAEDAWRAELGDDRAARRLASSYVALLRVSVAEHLGVSKSKMQLQEGTWLRVDQAVCGALVAPLRSTWFSCDGTRARDAVGTPPIHPNPSNHTTGKSSETSGR